MSSCEWRLPGEAPSWFCDLSGSDASPGEVVYLIALVVAFLAIVVVGCVAHGRARPPRPPASSLREWWDRLE